MYLLDAQWGSDDTRDEAIYGAQYETNYGRLDEAQFKLGESELSPDFDILILCI